MKSIRTLSAIFILSLSLTIPRAWSEEDNSPPFADVLQRLSRESRLELRTELVLLEIAIKSIETTRFLNDYAGGLDRFNVWITVPSVLFAGSEMAIQGTRLADGLVRVMTPEKAKWFAEYDELKAALRSAEKAYRKASRIGDPAAQEHHIRMLQSENALTGKLLQRPGKLYKFGRALRLFGRSTVVLAGVALTAVSINEALMLGIGLDQMAEHLEKFKQRAAEIEVMLMYQ